MLRLRCSILAHLLSSPASSPISSVQRLLSAAARHISPNPSFAVEEYLVDTCGLSQAQALKASVKISHIKSPSKPDAVHAFLADLGLTSAAVATAVARDPMLLCAKLEKTLAFNFAGLTGLGLSRSEVARLVSLAPDGFRCRSIVSKLVMTAHAKALGVPRGSGMFRQALQAVALLSEEKIAVKLENLKNTFRWSDAEVGIAVSKGPFILRRSKDVLQSRSSFLISEVGLEPGYIAHQPSLLTYSLEGRLKPRYYVVKFLKENGLVRRDPSYCSVVKLTQKVFVKKFICPHKVAAPHLSEDYAAACRGEVPANFRFL